MKFWGKCIPILAGAALVYAVSAAPVLAAPTISMRPTRDASHGQQRCARSPPGWAGRPRMRLPLAMAQTIWGCCNWRGRAWPCTPSRSSRRRRRSASTTAISAHCCICRAIARRNSSAADAQGDTPPRRKTRGSPTAAPGPGFARPGGRPRWVRSRPGPAPALPRGAGWSSSGMRARKGALPSCAIKAEPCIGFVTVQAGNAVARRIWPVTMPRQLRIGAVR